MDIVTYALLKKAGGGSSSSSNYIVDYYEHNHIHTTGSALTDIESPEIGALAYVRNDTKGEYYQLWGTASIPTNCIGHWIGDNYNIYVTEDNYKEVTRSGFDGPYIYNNKNEYLYKFILTSDDYIYIIDSNIDELVTVGVTEVYTFSMECADWYEEDEIWPAHPAGFYQYISSTWQFAQMKSNVLNLPFGVPFDVTQTYTFPISYQHIETLLNPTILRVTWSDFLLPAANANFVLDMVDGDIQLSTSCLVNIEGKNYNALVLITPNPDSSSQHQYIGNLSFVELGSGGGTTQTKTIYEFTLKTSTDGNAIGTDNYNEMYVEISEEKYQEYLTELNQIGRATSSSWQDIHTADEAIAFIRQSFQSLPGAMNSVLTFTFSLLVNYSLKENRNPYANLHFDVRSNYVPYTSYAVSVTIDSQSLDAQVRGGDYFLASGNASWFDLDDMYPETTLQLSSNSTVSYTTRQEVIGGSSSVVNKKYYNFVLQDSDGANSLSLQINIPYETMQDVYDEINQALGGNISTPQEVIAVYDSLKADNISGQAFTMLIQLFSGLAQVCLFKNLNNIYNDGDGYFKISGLIGLVGPAYNGNAPIFSDTLTSNKISFTSSSTLLIHERDEDELD